MIRNTLVPLLIGTGFATPILCTSANAQVYGKAQLGYAISGSANITDRDFANAGQLCGDLTCSVSGKIKDVGNSPLLAIGAGWNFGNNLRTDAMLTYRGWYKVDETMPDRTNFKADVTSWSFMVNGHYDFATQGVRPFVGVGLGMARNESDELTSTSPVVPGLTVKTPGGSKSSFAWSVAAGAAIPLSGSTVVELAVSYVDLGKVVFDFGEIVGNGVPSGFNYGGGEGKLRAWEFTVGFRF